MNRKEFNEYVKDVIVFPGTLTELNGAQLNEKGLPYFLMPMKASHKFISGTLIPSVEEMKETFSTMKNGSELVAKLVSMEKEEAKKMLDELLNQLIEKAEKMYNIPLILHADIRYRARQAGADGVIHFRQYGGENVFLGVPVTRGAE